MDRNAAAQGTGFPHGIPGCGCALKLKALKDSWEGAFWGWEHPEPSAVPLVVAWGCNSAHAERKFPFGAEFLHSFCSVCVKAAGGEQCQELGLHKTPWIPCRQLCFLSMKQFWVCVCCTREKSSTTERGIQHHRKREKSSTTEREIWIFPQGHLLLCTST